MATYPNEIWPPDSAIEALDGTIDAATGLPYVAKGTGPTSSPSYEVQYNRRQLRQNGILAPWRQGMVVDEGGLRIGVYPVGFTLGGVHRSYDGASGITVPDEVTRVVYLDGAGALQVAEAWPDDPGTYLPLAEVVTEAGAMTIEDRRTLAAFHVPASDRRVVTAYCANVGVNQAAAEVFQFDAPQDLLIEEVQVYCTATTASASVDVRANGATVLAAAAVPTAGTVVKPTITNDAVAASAPVTIHVTTNGSGTIVNLAVTLTFRAGTPA